MAKLNRQTLKAVMKEILVEIMMEGLDSNEALLESRQPRQQRQPKQRRSVQQTDIISETNNRSGLRQNVVDAAVAEVSSDPMMMDILRDTAQTTLNEQKEGRVVGDYAQQVAGEVDPMDLLPNSENWAAMAFGEVPKK